MSDKKWTPGPWRVGLNGSPSVRSVWTDGGDYHRFVASTECPSNAKIISAAPDMAEALDAICLQFPDDDVLRECAGRTSEDDDGKPVHKHWAQKILAARAALAKAKGEA